MLLTLKRRTLIRLKKWWLRHLNYYKSLLSKFSQARDFTLEVSPEEPTCLLMNRVQVTLTTKTLLLFHTTRTSLVLGRNLMLTCRQSWVCLINTRRTRIQMQRAVWAILPLSYYSSKSARLIASLKCSTGRTWRSAFSKVDIGKLFRALRDRAEKDAQRYLKTSTLNLSDWNWFANH